MHKEFPGTCPSSLWEGHHLLLIDWFLVLYPWQCGSTWGQKCVCAGRIRCWQSPVHPQASFGTAVGLPPRLPGSRHVRDALRWTSPFTGSAFQCQRQRQHFRLVLWPRQLGPQGSHRQVKTAKKGNRKRVEEGKTKRKRKEKGGYLHFQDWYIE